MVIQKIYKRRVINLIAFRYFKLYLLKAKLELNLEIVKLEKNSLTL